MTTTEATSTLAGAVYAAYRAYRMRGKSVASEGVVPAFIGEDGDESWHHVIDARMSGLKAKEIQRLFEADQKIDYSKPFSHRYCEHNEEDILQQIAPDYAENLSLADIGSIRRGVHRSREQGAVYQLFVREDDGEISGFIEFSLSVYAHVDEEEDPYAYFRENPTEPVELSLTASLDRIYVRKPYRSRGVAEAMLTCLGYAFKYELAHLKKKLLPHAKANKVPIVVEPTLYSEWCSRSGMVAHYKAFAHVEMACDWVKFDRSFKQNPFFTIKAVDSDGCY